MNFKGKIIKKRMKIKVVLLKFQMRLEREFIKKYMII